jgi:hypothetical protein
MWSEDGGCDGEEAPARAGLYTSSANASMKNALHDGLSLENGQAGSACPELAAAPRALPFLVK